MARRAVTWAEVVEVCEHPTIVEPPFEGRRRYHRGALCVVLGEDGTVVTVLLREVAQWTDADARARARA
jgi:hypothetical protein